MSSEQRSSSAVRNLRSIFENKTSLDSTPSSIRGRSPGELGGDRENGGGDSRRKSKIRASFVPVGSVGGMASTVEQGSLPAGAGTSPVYVNGDGIKKDLTNGAVDEMEAPLAKLDQALSTSGQTEMEHKEDKEPTNLDKPATAVEEEPGDTKPADLTSEKAVSGGEAIPAPSEDLRPSAQEHEAADVATSSVQKPTKKNGAAVGAKPATISTKVTPKNLSSSVKSPTSQPKTPTSANIVPSKPEKAKANHVSNQQKKASRSSLTAPTAASLARAGLAEKPTTKTSPDSKPKPRETTRPTKIPSHLTAPTAASRAKHEAVPAPAIATNFRASTTSRPKASTSSSKVTVRTSLAPQPRPNSRSSQTAGNRKSLPPPGSSFLERMTKPTAASASKTHEKPELKSPPRAKASPPKVKANGIPARSGPAKPKTTEKSKAAGDDKPGVMGTVQPGTEESKAAASATETALDAPAEDSEPAAGVLSTPQAAPLDYDGTGQAESSTETPKFSAPDVSENGAMEATPVDLGNEGLIR